MLDLISIKGLHTKLWAPKITRVSLGSPETKCHLGFGHVAKHKVYYKGEGGDFPEVWTVVNLVSSRLFVIHPNTKSAQIMH